MSSARDERRCALQALYQLDAVADTTPDLLRESLAGSGGSDQQRDEGLRLALAAWEARADADSAIGALAEDWPIHRQPIIDRNILRLAHYEMAAGDAPPKVVINEAIELAREFGTEKSPSFVNGILDKVYRDLRDAEPTGATG